MDRFTWWGNVLHPWNLTWNLKRSPWKRWFILETIILRFHPLNFGGVSLSANSGYKIKVETCHCFPAKYSSSKSRMSGDRLQTTEVQLHSSADHSPQTAIHPQKKTTENPSSIQHPPFGTTRANSVYFLKKVGAPDSFPESRKTSQPHDVADDIRLLTLDFFHEWDSSQKWCASRVVGISGFNFGFLGIYL